MTATWERVRDRKEETFLHIEPTRNATPHMRPINAGNVDKGLNETGNFVGIAQACLFPPQDPALPGAGRLPARLRLVRESASESPAGNDRFKPKREDRQEPGTRTRDERRRRKPCPAALTTRTSGRSF